MGVSHRLAASKEAGASSGAEGCNGASFWWGEGSQAQGLVLELEKWRIFPEPPTLMGGKSGCQ